MDRTPDPLGRFLPQYLRAHCARSPRAQPADSWSLSGAMLFVDLVGFTARVEQLVAGGPEGVELATGLLNDTIGSLVSELVAAGGDVTVFAGDALFVLWPQLESEADLAPSVLHAAQAALRALAMARPRARSAPSMRFALGAGSFTAQRVGGHAERWQVLLSGPALAQIGRLASLDRNDALLVSAEACALAAGGMLGTALGDGAQQVHALSRLPAVARAAPAPPDIGDAELQAYLSDALTPFAGAAAPAEFRHPSALFARLPGLLRGDAIDGALAQAATAAVQAIVAELDGTVLQFVVDDKGPVFVIAFGLTARVHEDDPARAALAALRIVQALTELGVACGVGVATGRVFCGTIGSDARCSYTLIGQTMNLAARLMQRAAPGPLVDETTRELSRHRVHYEPEGLLRAKGLDREVPHYRAVAAAAAVPTRERGRLPLFGRARELDILEGELERLQRERRGGLVVLVGEAGIGKSRLVLELVARAGARGVASQIADAGAIESGPAARWRPVLQALITQAPTDPFLRAFLGHAQEALPDADDAERAFRTREAIAAIILDAAQRQPLLLCVEDTHWMDSLSWALVTRLAQASAAGAPLLLVLAARELETRAPPDALARLAQAGLLRLPLGPLPAEDRSRVAQLALGVDELPPALNEWIGAQSGGNPLFCRELAVAALESGRVRRVGTHIELHPRLWSDSLATPLPDTLQGLIASRLDRLDQSAQQTLRVAAVIGARFTRTALQALLAEASSDPEPELQRLLGAGFIAREAGSVDEAYAFHHALVRDAAYDSLPYRRRRELHARLALWLEQRFADDLAPQAATLAFHWERAEAWETAYGARLRAGEAALQSYSNREAVAHFEAAAQIRQRLPALEARAQAIAAELGLARALHRMGDERHARGHIEQALRAAGEALPGGPMARVVAIVGELLWRALPGRRLLRSAAPARLRARVAAYDLLPEILYYDNDPLALTHATLRFLRLAEAEGARSAEHARARAWYALLCAGLGRRRAMDAEFDQALQLAAAADHPAVDAWIRLARGSTLAQLGAWSDAERWLLDARARCAALGDRTRWWNVTSGLAHVLAYRGELQQAEALLREAIEVNRDTDNPLFLCWGLSGHADILHRLGHAGDTSEVLRSLRRAREALAQRPDAAADVFSRGVLAAALWRAGHVDEAWDLARETLGQALHRAPVVWLQVSSYLGLSFVLVEAAQDRARRDEALRGMVQLERSLRGFARLIPIARPALALLRGEIEGLRGRRAQAHRQFDLALALAEAFGQPLETGKALLALAATGDAALAARTLDRAETTFTRIGARWHSARARGQRERLAGF